MTTLKIGIATCEEMRARTLAIASGDLTPKAEDPKVWLTSTASFAKLLSNKNRALLAAISEQHPVSISALAEATGRALGNLSRSLKTMERYGLVKLHRGERGMVRPEVLYSSVQLSMDLQSEHSA